MFAFGQIAFTRVKGGGVRCVWKVLWHFTAIFFPPSILILLDLLV